MELPAAPVTAATPDEAAETACINAWLDRKYEEQLDFSSMTRGYAGEKRDEDKIDDLSEGVAGCQLE